MGRLSSGRREPDEGGQRFTPVQRVLRSRSAAYASWARTSDRSARTAPARRAALERFEREVDPEGVLPAAERAARATAARKAYFTALALRSSRARGRRAARTSQTGVA